MWSNFFLGPLSYPVRVCRHNSESRKSGDKSTTVRDNETEAVAKFLSSLAPSLPRSFPHPLGLGLGSPSNTPLEVQDLPELLRAAKYLIVIPASVPKALHSRLRRYRVFSLLFCTHSYFFIDWHGTSWDLRGEVFPSELFSVEPCWKTKTLVPPFHLTSAGGPVRKWG